MAPYEGSLGQALWWHTLFGLLLYVIWRLPVPRSGKDGGAGKPERSPRAEAGRRKAGIE